MESPIVVNVPHLLSEYRQGTSTVAKSGGGGISGAISQIREKTQFYDKVAAKSS